MKKTILAAFLIASAQTSANEIQNLIDTSQSLKDTFAYGIKFVGGAASYAAIGGIAPTGMAKQAYVSKAQQDAYNAALTQVQQANLSYDPGAQQYFDEQANNAMSAVNQAVDAYVQAAAVLIEATTVNEMAQDAQASGDDRLAIELQAYVNENPVQMTDADVANYNDSLDMVEQSAQVAAAYTAVANDQSLIASANDQAGVYMASYNEATGASFDAQAGVVTIAFDTYAMNVQLSVVDYFKQDIDIINHGAETDFFRTSPVGECWYAIDIEACLNGPV